MTVLGFGKKGETIAGASFRAAPCGVGIDDDWGTAIQADYKKRNT